MRYKGLVPELYQDGLDANGDYYIAMERIAGQSLADVMKSAPRPSRETAQMGLALADFLRKLHGLSESDNTEEPIVHWISSPITSWCSPMAASACSISASPRRCAPTAR